MPGVVVSAAGAAPREKALPMLLVDSHCHLDRLKLDPYLILPNGEPSADPLGAALDAALARGVGQYLCISVTRDNIQTVIDLAHKYPRVLASVGVHPCDVAAGTVNFDELAAFAAQDKVVALGETGLDYHYETESKALQHESFILHLEAGKTLDLPIVVHTREARQDTLNLIRQHGSVDSSGVLHCFTEDWDMAKKALDLNYFISISGIVTFKNAEQIRDVVRNIPLEYLLVETDSPYLAPIPFRGKPNEPKNLRDTAQYIADLRGIHLEELAEITTNNFYRLFKRAAAYRPTV